MTDGKQEVKPKAQLPVLGGAQQRTEDVAPALLINAETLLEHFKAIVQSSDDAIISKTVNGIVTSWNKGAERLFGYAAHEMIGGTMMALFPTTRTAEEIFILEKIVAGEKVDHFETVRLRKDGTEINVSVTISPIRDAKGNVIGASKIARDITERIDLEAAAKQFEAIVRSSDDAIISKTLDGIVTSWNRGAQNIFGYSANEMVGKSMLPLFPADRNNEERFILEKIVAGEKVEHFETVRLRKDGSRIDVSVTISPIWNKNGQIIGASKIARDISLRKNAEAQLELSSKVFKHSSEAIIITDSVGIIIDVNDAFTRITGYARDEVVGKNMSLLKASQQAPKLISNMIRSLGLVGNCQGEVWICPKHGNAYESLVTISAVKSNDGQVQNHVAIFADITSLKKNQEQLEHLAHFDALTDLPNRLLLSDRLSQAMVMSKRQQQSLAVLYLDIDQFKEINDRFGHDVGDELLIAISRRMKNVLRETDTLARIGGDEFVLVLVNIQSPQNCGLLVDRILKACSEPVILHDQLMRVSASIGVTLYPQDDANVDQLLRHADQAMYEAKQAGKNRYHMFDTVHDAEIKNKGEQLEQIALAISRNEFVLYYQPKVNMKLGTVIGVEALIRWQHPQKGLLPPAAFLPIVEDHPLSDAIGAWVIDAALAQMTAWQRAGLRTSVSVNIGARQLQQSGFAAALAAMLECYPEVDPTDFELEILETSALQDMNAVSQVMQECRQLGVVFAVDDFGTGYSSLTYLKRLPAATLKVDQSFVRDMLDDHEDLAIVRGVIGLAVAFRRKVIAEGVETIAHGEKLLQLDCHLAQGYGIARPMPSDKLLDWVATWQPHPDWAKYAGEDAASQG